VQRGQQPLLWSEWRALQQRYPNLLRCELWNTNQQGRPTALDLEKRLQTLSPSVEVFVCGNHGYREVVEKACWAQQLPAAQLHMESFYQLVTAPQLAPETQVVAKVKLNDGRQIPVQQGQTILQAAKAAGVTMQHCCGQGVCRSCETRKVSGVVENIQTGLKQLRDGEWILPCISAPVGNVELAI
jgi:ferredoxin